MLGRWVTATALVAVLSAVTGCAAEVPTPGQSDAPAYDSGWEAPEATAIAPLRGTTVPSGSLDRPAISAKIDNHWDARPQTGLERSDIVFEELVEGGITRYVAVWHSDIPDLIGPVRSIRPMDPDIASPFGGIIFYAGGQPQFVEMMRNTPVYNAIHGQPDTADYMYRIKERAAPHNVLAKAKEFADSHGDIAAPPVQFAFAVDAASSTAAHDGTPTTAINTTFSTGFHSSWTFDADSGLFVRSQNGDIDRDSDGKPLTATNVVVVRVPVSPGPVPKTEMIGSGEAWVSTAGKTVHATWTKSSATDSIHLRDDRGVTVRLGAGNTWVELVPLDGAADFVSP